MPYTFRKHHGSPKDDTPVATQDQDQTQETTDETPEQRPVDEANEEAANDGRTESGEGEAQDQGTPADPMAPETGSQENKVQGSQEAKPKRTRKSK